MSTSVAVESGPFADENRRAFHRLAASLDGANKPFELRKDSGELVALWASDGVVEVRYWFGTGQLALNTTTMRMSRDRSGYIARGSIEDKARYFLLALLRAAGQP